MIALLTAVFGTLVLILTWLAIRRQVRAHQELRRSIRELESSYKELSESIGSAIEALEGTIKPSEPKNDESIESYLTVYRATHFDKAHHGVYAQLVYNRQPFIALDAPRDWHDEDDDYDSVLIQPRWAN